ncbi:MAG: Lrp/AsnC family transcriptional regulator [Phycicoccus sp.]|nr:Lrp/AsnC family transcriptional regulator [Phycicoccus sp.]
MATLDDLDRRILSLLSADGRAPVSGLADRLGVARGTVQARIDRLVAQGVIRRFTIDLAGDDEGRVRALCLIRLSHSTTRTILRRLRERPEVQDVYSTNGKWDLVAMIVAPSLEGLDETLAWIRTVSVVETTETSILLRRL